MVLWLFPKSTCPNAVKFGQLSITLECFESFPLELKTCLVTQKNVLSSNFISNWRNLLVEIFWIQIQIFPQNAPKLQNRPYFYVFRSAFFSDSPMLQVSTEKLPLTPLKVSILRFLEVQFFFFHLCIF